jgi:hypothetical protein
MAGGDADAGPTAQIPHRPAQGRRGLQPGVDIGGNPVGRQHPGRLPGKQLPFDAAVVGDGCGLGQVCGVEVVRQGLGGPPDGVDVHPVGSRADNAPQPAGAEGQMAVEAVGHRLLVLPRLPQLRDEVRVLPRPLQPAVQLRLIVHVASSLSENHQKISMFCCQHTTPGWKKQEYLSSPHRKQKTWSVSSPSLLTSLFQRDRHPADRNGGEAVHIHQLV